jgi:hypothetical protein
MYKGICNATMVYLKGILIYRKYFVSLDLQGTTSNLKKPSHLSHYIIKIFPYIIS